MRSGHAVGSVCALAMGLVTVGCGDTASEEPADAGPSAPTGVFQPAGCGFSISTRPDYTDFVPGKPDVGPTPNIRRVRRGLGGNVAVGAEGRADPATTAAFAWQTDDGTLATEVTWGETPEPASWPAANRLSGVTWKTPEGAIRPNGDARMHEAYVCGLSPAKTYYYRVGGGPAGGEVWSDVYAFTTTPSGDEKVTLAVSGDSRGQNNDAWRLLQKRVLAKGVTAQLFSGDVVDLAPDQGEWEQWLDAAWKDTDGSFLTLGQVLSLYAHGNHENHTTLFFGNLVQPQDATAFPAYAELFYSVDIGPVHVVVIDDAFVAAPSGDPAYADLLGSWLAADLGAADARRAEVPWIVTMHHHSEYSSSKHGKDPDVLRGRAFFTPIWDRFHVDLAVGGHDHNYERTKPLTGPADAPSIKSSFAEGTVYVVSGGAGAEAYAAGTSAFTEVSRDTQTGGAFGFYTFLIATKASLVIETRELRADATDPVFDTVTITK